MFKITQLARLAGISRSTLLYYDRTGLLRPSGRTEAGYRQYSQQDRERLSTICSLRQAGLSIEDIRLILSKDEKSEADVLQRRLREVAQEILALQAQQHLLAKMLQVQLREDETMKVDKKIWTEMLAAAGMDDAAMMRWHAEFERRAPDAHHRFLLSLGISEEEAQVIRKMSQTEKGE